MSRKIKTSRVWYNFKDSVVYYFKLLFFHKDPYNWDAMDDRLETDNRINKKLGLPKVGEDKNFFRY